MNKSQLLSNYRTTYPDLNNIDDDKLFNALVKKFPEYKNEITEHFNTEQTFRENVLEYRKKSYGTRDAIQTIMSW